MNRGKKFYSYFQNLSILFLSLTILPFLILSIYTNPAWDDFEHFALTTQYGILEAQYIWYQTWTGTFFSVAVLSIFNPLVYKSMLGYKLIPIIIIIGFLISSYYLIKEITFKSISRKEVLICTLAFCSLYFFKMTNVALGIFWMTASLKYQLANILMMILFLLILKLFREETTKKKSLLKVYIILLIFATVGSSEVHLVVLLVLFFAIFAIYYLVNKKVNWQLFYFLIAAIVASLIVYLSPGNKVRAKTFPGSQQFIYSITTSISDVIQFIPYRIISTPILLFTLLFIPVCIKVIHSRKINQSFISINPIYPMILLFIVLVSCSFTTYWSVGGGPLDRTMNVFYFLFLVGWFTNVLILTNYIKNKFRLRLNYLPNYALIIIGIIIVFSYRRDNNIRIAYEDLLTGTSHTFDEELKNRYRKIYADESDTCIVGSIKSPVPKLFFFSDVDSDPHFWVNKAEALYFNKKFFIVKKEDSDSSQNK